MTTTLPPDWQRICGARFRRRADLVASNFVQDFTDLAGCRNLDEWFGIEPGRLCFGSVNGACDIVRDATYWTIEWRPELVDPDSDSLKYVTEDGLTTIPIFERKSFAGIFDGWELVGYLYREAE